MVQRQRDKWTKVIPHHVHGHKKMAWRYKCCCSVFSGVGVAFVERRLIHPLCLYGLATNHSSALLMGK